MIDVTDVLRDRLEPPSGLQRMVTISLLAHLALGALLVIAPRSLFGRRANEPRSVMTISLSGAGEGPRNGGFTAAAAQPVQVQTPPEALNKREAARPPAAKTPEMVLPANKTTKNAKTPTPVTQAPDDARGRTPTRGAQTAPGQAVAYTGARGQGFGLSTGGGAGTGSFLDVTDFCCPDYIVVMVDRIRSAWNEKQGATGIVRVKFTIQRSGAIVNPSVETGSGNSTLDLAALRAVMMTRTLPPLPNQFQEPTLPVHLTFEYK
jgi:TonB family protein